MVNAIQNPGSGQAAGQTPAAEAVRQAAAGQATKPQRTSRRSTVNFQQALAHAQKARAKAASQTPPQARTPSTAQAASRSVGAGTLGAVRQTSVRPAAQMRPRTAPEEAASALTQAMAREGVPDAWRPGLDFIMDKESRGQIDARNPIHSARGLFQLTRVNYHLNPNGEASFGNGVEEAQGGIRYIKQRYGEVDKAVAHWHRKGWY